MDQDEAARVFREFVAVIKALRTPGTGCPWDLEQDHHTLKPYLVEETYEVLDAIDRDDDHHLREELGDLLLQVVLHAQVADDRGAFSITEVVHGISEKMVRRHPHVFGSVRVSGAAEVVRNWEQIKAEEAQARGQARSAADALDRLPESLPALLRAQRLGEKAAKDQPDPISVAGALNQVRHAFAQLEQHARALPDVSAPASPGELPDDLRGQLGRELGEVLFGLCQLARRLGLNAEESLRATNRGFVERFRQEQGQGPEGKTPAAKEERP